MKRMINVGILGLGTVGRGVLEVWERNELEINKAVGMRVNIEKIADTDITKSHGIKLNNSKFVHGSWTVINNPEIDVIVEAIGGIDPAKAYILEAIKRGKNVVTSNKELVAKHGPEIFKEAIKHKVDFRFGASVCGGVPVISALEDVASCDRIQKIMGILNGTTNLILTEMSERRTSFRKALKKAQQNGFAEADPRNDIEGFDTVYKLVILSMVVFGAWVKVDSVFREGISKITPEDIGFAKSHGYVIKLLAVAEEIDDGLGLRVHPVFLPESHDLAQVKGVKNALFIVGVGDALEQGIELRGPGAGGMPTGASILRDIKRIAKNIAQGATGKSIPQLRERKFRPIEELKSRYYMRIKALDQARVLAKISDILGNNQISIASVVQPDELTSQGIAQIFFLTHEAEEREMQESLKEISRLDVVKEVSNMVRVEE